MSSRYNVVVVGMGKRGKHHASAFKANPNFNLVGICDIDQARLTAAAAELGNPQTSTDAAALTKSLKPDVFCFCTMPNLRIPLIKIGVENGVKMIAFEKPVADSSKAALEIKAMLSGSRIKTVVSHQHRYGVHYSKVKEIVASGAIGKTHTILATSPGWMMHMMTHMIDYMRWYNNNAEAEWVMAQAAGRSKLSDNHPSPDYIAGIIQFANGVRGIVETGAGAPNIPEVAKWWGRNRISVMGENGFAEVLTNGGWRAVTKDGMTSGGGCMDYALDMPPYIQEMAAWLNDDSKIHSCNFDSACKGFDIMMGMCRSVVEGGQVAMPLSGGMLEIDALREKIPGRQVLLSSPDHAKEFGL